MPTYRIPHRIHRLRMRAMNRLKWALSVVSGLITTGFVLVLEA